MYTKQIKSDDKIFYLSLKSNHNCNLLKVKKYQKITKIFLQNTKIHKLIVYLNSFRSLTFCHVFS